MPMVLIIVLISSLVSSYFFNINLIELPRHIGEKVQLGDFSVSRVNAGTTATTSVTVRNAPPNWTVNATVTPGNAPENPANEGETAVYTGTGDDPEDNNYYLIVCSSNAVTAHNGGAPTCDATTYCTSGSTADTSQATCNFNPVAAFAGVENPTTYSFLCDNHASQADCSSVQNVTIYVNHKPVINALSTTVNNIDPGATTTITATTTDTDVMGSNDTLRLFVCSTNSFSTSTGCAATTYCSSTPVSANGSTPVAVSCDYNIPIPTADQAYGYYGFVMDSHNLATSSLASSFTVNNVSPSLGSTFLNSGNPITVQLKGATTTVWASSTSVTDNNGCTDLNAATATSTVYYSGATNGANCTANNNDCYQIGASSCTISNCAGTTAQVACSAGLAFHTAPTAGDGSDGNTRSGGDWLARITVNDGALASSTISSGVELNYTTALDVTETSIPYGTIKSGQNSGSSNATTTVVNFGNTPLDSGVYGSDMSDGGVNTIAIGQQHWSLANFTYPAGASTTASTATTSMNVARPTNASAFSSPIYWGIGVPGGKPSGVYSGINTFVAILRSSAGNWN